MRSFEDFLIASPTSYHTVETVAAELEAAGYTQQREDEGWSADVGGHYVIRDGALIAYRVPGRLGPRPTLRLVGAHTDSAGFKLKPHPAHAAGGFEQAGMEVYGGPLLNSWLDREFGLAGRVVLASGEVRLVQTPAWLRIPQMAPHLDRSVHDSLHLDPQEHMMPVTGLTSRHVDLLAAVAASVGCGADDIAGHDLLSYNPQPPARFGVGGDFLAASRLDDLTGVYAAVAALLDASESDTIPVVALFDHEEIGSGTRSGAGGPLLSTVLERLTLALGIVGDDAYQLYARSVLISVDAGHSTHPNYLRLYDPDERPVMGAGPLLKVNAKGRYTTDGSGTALWARLCAAADVPSQTYVSHNGVPCGTTIGPIVARQLGVTTLDVGVGLLSMHSAREMCSPDDVAGLGAILTLYLSGA